MAESVADEISPSPTGYSCRCGAASVQVHERCGHAFRVARVLQRSAWRLNASFEFPARNESLAWPSETNYNEFEYAPRPHAHTVISPTAGPAIRSLPLASPLRGGCFATVQSARATRVLQLPRLWWVPLVSQGGIPCIPCGTASLELVSCDRRFTGPV